MITLGSRIRVTTSRWANQFNKEGTVIHIVNPNSYEYETRGFRIKVQLDDNEIRYYSYSDVSLVTIDYQADQESEEDDLL